MKVHSVTPVKEGEPSRAGQQAPRKHPVSPFEVKSPSDSRFELVSEDGNEVVYRAVDPETGVVLTQVPSEEVLRVARRLEELRAEGKLK